MNVWQYLVLLEGLGAIGTAAGLAQEAIRSAPLKIIGYANLGVMLICVSLVVSIGAALGSRPNAATWIAGVGFALYGAAAVGAWSSRLRLRPVHRRTHLRIPHSR